MLAPEPITMSQFESAEESNSIPPQPEKRAFVTRRLSFLTLRG